MVEFLKGTGSLRTSDGRSVGIGVTTPPLGTLPSQIRSSVINGVGRASAGVRIPGSITSAGVPSPGVYSPGVPPLSSPAGYSPEGTLPMNGLTTPTGNQTTFWNEQKFRKWWFPGTEPPPPPLTSPEDVPPPIEPEAGTGSAIATGSGSIFGIDYLTLALGVILAVLLFTGGKKKR